MYTFIKGLFLVCFLHTSFSISIQGLVPSKYINDKTAQVLTEFSDQHGGIRSEGIFVRFIRKILDLLTTTFPERKLIRYCRVLSRELDKMEFTSTKGLAKHFRYLSRLYREEIKAEMKEYRRELDKVLPFRTEFLEAMNEVFTLRENLQFEDYLHDFKDYGNEDKLFIDEETRKLLNDVIVGAITKLSSRDQRDLLKKMKRAVREFKSSRNEEPFQLGNDTLLIKYLSEVEI